MIKTILLADDSITMQKVIRLTFASGGYELYCADNGDEALKKAEDLKPNIVLVDAALPGKNGYEVCRGIKDNPELKNTPVMILAGTFNPLDDEKARNAECDDSIVKPFESKQLVAKVESLFRKYPPVKTTSSEQAMRGETAAWADDDVIRAPEPSSIADASLRSFTEDTVRSENAPDLEVLNGRGSIERPDEDITPEQNTQEETAAPKMETASGELEGEGGFDIEGFEINPFKSEPLRETSPIDNRDKGLNTWNVEEDDLIAFDGAETECEIETESGAAPVAEDEPLIEEPVANTAEAEAELNEDIISAPEKSADEEPIEAAIEGEASAEGKDIRDEACIRDLVKKISLEIMEDVTRENAPALVKEAVEEAVRENAPALIKEAVEEAVRENTPSLIKEAVEEAVRENTPSLIKEAVEEAVRKNTPALIKEAVEEVVRENTPRLVKEGVEEEMERIRKAIREL